MNHAKLVQLISRVISPPAERKIVLQAGEMGAIGTYGGRVRQSNQDRAAIAEIVDSRFPENPLIIGVLCDGMGGMVGGGDAATLALATFLSAIANSDSRSSSTARLDYSVRKANDAVFSLLKGTGGTTLSAALIHPDVGIATVNVGDSRIYTLDGDRNPTQVTEDDTLEATLRRQKLDAPADVGNQLVQFVGIGPDIEPRTAEFSEDKDIHSILLTSDGAHDTAPSTLKAISSHSQSNMDLVRKCLTLAEITGGKDNATSVVLNTTQPLVRIPPPAENCRLIRIWATSGITSDIIESFEERIRHDISQRSNVLEEQDKRSNRKRSGKINPTKKRPSSKKAGYVKEAVADQKPQNLSINFPKEGSD